MTPEVVYDTIVISAPVFNHMLAAFLGRAQQRVRVMCEFYIINSVLLIEQQLLSGASEHVIDIDTVIF
jgi:hypothetical protein